MKHLPELMTLQGTDPQESYSAMVTVTPKAVELHTIMNLSLDRESVRAVCKRLLYLLDNIYE
jgi:hypothetical protein